MVTDATYARVKPGGAHDWKNREEDIPGCQKTSKLEGTALCHVRLGGSIYLHIIAINQIFDFHHVMVGQLHREL